MRETLHRIRHHTLFRAAIAAPIAAVLLFSLFNLTAPMDQSRVPAAITVAIVNLDAGAPGAPTRASDQLLRGLSGGLPVAVAPYADEAAARTALDHGDISAALIIPADFTAKAMSPDPATVTFLASQHLSVVETQLTGALSEQLAASLSAAVAAMRQAAATGQPPAPPQPAVTVTTELLHVAGSPAALSAPFVMTFATWIASFVGGLMLFLATRPERGPATAAPVATLRSAVPIVVSALASLALAVTVAATVGMWSSFLALWGTIWLTMAAIALLVIGLFSVLDFWAILLVLPAVFYQSALSGAQIPVAAAPDWLRSIGEAIPFSNVATGYRSLVIGGPDGSVAIGLLLGVAALGLALIWGGTYLYRLARQPRPAHA